MLVNGKEVYSVMAHRAAIPEQDEARARLQAGLNRVLVKINNGDGDHGLYFTVQGEQTLKQAAPK